jgi:hypothetical protein
MVIITRTRPPQLRERIQAPKQSQRRPRTEHSPAPIRRNVQPIPLLALLPDLAPRLHRNLSRLLVLVEEAQREARERGGTRDGGQVLGAAGGHETGEVVGEEVGARALDGRLEVGGGVGDRDRYCEGCGGCEAQGRRAGLETARLGP